MAGRHVVALGVSLLGGTLAVVGAGAAAGHGGALSAGPAGPVILTVVVTLVGVGVAWVITMFIRALLEARPSPSAVGGPKGRWWARLLGALAAIAMVGGIWTFFLATTPRRHHLAGPLATTGDRATQALVHHGATRNLNGGAALATLAVVGVVAAFVAIRRARNRRAGDFSWLAPIAAPESQPEDVIAVSPEAALSVEAPPRLLADPRNVADPRLAVIAAYERFAAGMSDAGMPRGENETPLEYSSRIAHAMPADVAGSGRSLGGSLTRLTNLFNTARYGSAGDESDRAAALACLGDLEAGVSRSALRGAG